MNVKPDEITVGTDGEIVEINEVSLLDVSQSVKLFTKINEEGELLPPLASKKTIKTFPIAKLAESAIGYTVSHQGIVFGSLRGIRIHWSEHRNEGFNVVDHIVDYEFQSVVPIVLQSGKKYIYNISLRRGTIATISPSITDWEVGSTASANGTIVKP